MKKNTKVRVTNDGLKGFFGRAREHARQLDRGESLASEMTISFENPSDILQILSPQRIRILQFAKKGAKPLSILASGLKRDPRAVSRDVELLEHFGLLRTRYQTNPGHGKRRIVEARAGKIPARGLGLKQVAWIGGWRAAKYPLAKTRETARDARDRSALEEFVLTRRLHLTPRLWPLRLGLLRLRFTCGRVHAGGAFHPLRPSLDIP